MPVIEGFGDEITYFLISLLTVLIAFLAWWSTRLREDNRTTVIIFERGGQHAIVQRNSIQRIVRNRLLPRSLSTSLIPMEQPISMDRQTPSDDVILSNTTLTATTTDTDDTYPESTDSDITEVIKKMDSDSDTCALNTAQDNATTSNKEPNSNGATSDSLPQEAREEEVVDRSNDSIKIRLKFINDDVKLVDGRLEETVGDFKRRHFATELMDHKIIRLIFNGQVLLCEHETLGRYGIHDNCVVHCLVQNPNLNSPQSNAAQQGDGVPLLSGSSPRHDMNHDCDLSIYLYITLVIAMGVGWWMQITESHLFSWHSTAILICLSGFIIFWIIGTYVPNLFPRDTNLNNSVMPNTN